MRKSILFLFLIFRLTVLAQSISVSSFKLLDTDLTANTAGTMEMDQNGETAALIKVVTTQTGFSFDGGALGIVKTKQTPGEVWVYIPRGAKKISIKHPQLGVLRDYYFPCAIEAARTYEMVLISGEVRTIVKEKANSQYIVIQVSPANAIIEFDNEILPTTNGYAQKFVKLGTYEYRVQAKDYHTTAGKVTVDDPKHKKVLELILEPAFGWIRIPRHDEYNGAQVFIDNTLIGAIPLNPYKLLSGKHNLKIVKDLYSPSFQSLTIKDNDTTTVTPILNANYSEVSINVENDAEIYVNEVLKGNGTWKGKLEPGIYMIEAKKKGHKSTQKVIEIKPQQNIQEFGLIAPSPIFGSVNITSNPSDSEIYIDEAPVGNSPILLPDILIGEHQIKIKHKGYKDCISTVVVRENETSTIEVLMEDEKLTTVHFRCNVPGAIVYVDGEKFGKIEDLKKLSPGKHEIRVVSEGFKDYEISIFTGLSFYEYNVKMVPDKSSIKRKKKKSIW